MRKDVSYVIFDNYIVANLIISHVTIFIMRLEQVLQAQMLNAILPNTVLLT